MADCGDLVLVVIVDVVGAGVPVVDKVIVDEGEASDVEHDVDRELDADGGESLLESEGSIVGPVSVGEVAVVLFVVSDAPTNTVDTTVSVTAGTVTGSAVTVFVTSEYCVNVRISVLVTGAVDEPPSTATTEYCTALLGGCCCSFGGVSGRA